MQNNIYAYARMDEKDKCVTKYIDYVTYFVLLNMTQSRYFLFHRNSNNV